VITADELRRVPLFAALPDNEAASLAARVADVRLRAGDWLIQEGEQPSFFLLLEGSLEVRKVVHGVERRITQYDQGDYFGELPLLLGSPAIVSCARSSRRVSRSSTRPISGNCSRRARRWLPN
jgi:thioredoxin reductase (NADPH)